MKISRENKWKIVCFVCLQGDSDRDHPNTLAHYSIFLLIIIITIITSNVCGQFLLEINNTYIIGEGKYIGASNEQIPVESRSFKYEFICDYWAIGRRLFWIMKWNCGYTTAKNVIK